MMQPIPLEDKVEMSREKVGLATWEEMVCCCYKRWVLNSYTGTDDGFWILALPSEVDDYSWIVYTTCLNVCIVCMYVPVEMMDDYHL